MIIKQRDVQLMLSYLGLQKSGLSVADRGTSGSIGRRL